VSLMDLSDAAAKVGFSSRFLLSERVMNCVTADAGDKCNWLRVVHHAGLVRDARGDDDRATVLLHSKGVPGQLLILVEPADQGRLMVKVVFADEAIGC